MNRLSDLRDSPATMDEATVLFNNLARNILTVEARSAALEKRIATLKAQHEAATADLASAIQEDAQALTRFIELNRPLFKNPRKVKTSFGSFGLQTVSELVVTDQEKVVEALLDRGYEDCFKTVTTLVKPPIKARLEAGEKLIGVSVKTGDTAVYKVDRALIQNARKNEEADA
jgi:phage host-nuclease inhibitor protein Gam